MILDEILRQKRIDVERQKRENPLPPPTGRANGNRFAAALCTGGAVPAVIAEVKKASPSKGVIRQAFDHREIALAYRGGGAAAISVLTEEHFFQGSAQFLADIREAVDTPLLRKDFIIDEYQLQEAASLGADAVLLIAAALTDGELGRLSHAAAAAGLAVLAEVHTEGELERVLAAGCPIIGVNNRDLRTFHVDLAVTERLIRHIPKDRIVVSESGIKTHGQLLRLGEWGVSAVLVGETFMRQSDVRRALLEMRGVYDKG